jgi:hypothetical protein
MAQSDRIAPFLRFLFGPGPLAKKPHSRYYFPGIQPAQPQRVLPEFLKK